ncbi:hypothetical protein NHX12_000205, partial [Muraenolepis orangiensis]
LLRRKHFLEDFVCLDLRKALKKRLRTLSGREAGLLSAFLLTSSAVGGPEREVRYTCRAANARESAAQTLAVGTRKRRHKDGSFLRNREG